MLLAWLFVLTPLVLFLAGFITETYLAFKRLRDPSLTGTYLDFTWELTHTLLVVSVAIFVGLFSQNLVEIAKAVYFGVFTIAIFVGVRTLCYLYLAFIKPRSKKDPLSAIDYVFAYSHIGIVLGLGVLLIQLIPKLLSIDLKANTQFIPWMWPGLFIVLAVGLMPAMSLYRTNKRK
ncbi:MAG TPA: hypothetical protein PKD20_05680 [Candidatus Saccharibacteria bacterium]|jgi:hypothetical protein|nr:hypothetical protein [Candidatus Saccharibacteria bacterium]HMT56332.1 hypothetical protein [Candidatus Saccharibacteria bacterium]